MAKTIKVKSVLTDDTVVLWEVNPDHPGGEVFIKADGKTHDVAETVQVQALIKAGRLEAVKSGSTSK